MTEHTSIDEAVNNEARMFVASDGYIGDPLTFTNALCRPANFVSEQHMNDSKYLPCLPLPSIDTQTWDTTRDPSHETLLDSAMSPLGSHWSCDTGYALYERTSAPLLSNLLPTQSAGLVADIVELDEATSKVSQRLKTAKPLHSLKKGPKDFP